MNRTDAPKKQPVPFAVNGQREDLLNTTPAGDNTASYDAGFPPVTMILKAAGGLPPKGQDINQILFELSSLSRWASTGALNTYDATFSSSIGGYPKGAVLLSNNASNIFISTADGNSNDPNSVSTGWLSLLSFLGGAPINSPVFTGTPAGPTADPTTNTTQLSTTAFVKTAINNLNLGTASTRNIGNGSGQVPDMSFWTTSSGWRKMPDGVIEQWGVSGATNDTVSVTFPIQFTSAVYWIGEHDTGGGNRMTLWQLNSITGTGFQARNIGSVIKGDTAVEASITANCIWYARGK